MINRVTHIVVNIQKDDIYIVLGNIPVISLHRGIEFIPVTLLRIPLYGYFINYIFLWLRGGHEVISRVANT